MKTVLLLLAVFGCLSAFRLDIDELKQRGFSLDNSKFGDVLMSKSDGLSSQSALLKFGNVLDDPVLYESFLTGVLEHSRVDRKPDLLKCAKGKHAEFFKVGAAEVGYIGNHSQTETIVLSRLDDDCFGKVEVNFTYIKNNANNTVVISMRAENRTHQGCSEAYILGTGANFHVTTFTLKHQHTFTWKNLNEVEINNVRTWGIHIFRLCDEVKHWLPNLIQTVEIFLGGLGLNPRVPFFGSKTPHYQQELNIKFIQAGTGYRWKPRPNVFTNLSELEVKSGDFLAITRLDGVDQIIQYGAGSHAGHSAVILEVDGELCVVESQDGWYWPKHGIQRNKWSVWKKWANNAGFNVAVLPLTEESRKKFDVEKAAKFFKEMEGYPYGYHNFLFGWIDLAEGNLPPLLDKNLIMVVFSLIERLYQLPIKKILTEALNMRLKTKGLKMAEVAVEIAKRNMTLADLLAIKEEDGWHYSDGPSYVCSSFVSAVYRAGELLKDVEGTQMTPRDVYTLNIFNKNYKVPAKCLTNDPSLPYCQIMGRFLMELPGYASIEPYPHMCERCPTVAPDFFRPEGC